MASSTTTRKPANLTVDAPAGADRNAGIVLGVAVIAMGLVAGLFYFSSIAVMPALTAADDRTLVDAMQQMFLLCQVEAAVGRVAVDGDGARRRARGR